MIHFYASLILYILISIQKKNTSLHGENLDPVFAKNLQTLIHFILTLTLYTFHPPTWPGYKAILTHLHEQEVSMLS